MKWHFIDTGINTGRFNMDFDIRLAGICSADEAYFRLYRWNPYCISLGANQTIDELDENRTAIDGIDIVKRPTGGRAILHAEELTYSVIIPVNAGYSSSGIYRKVSLGLVNGLRLFDPLLQEVELETIHPDFKKLLQEPSGAICFASTAKSEIKYRGMKLVGSAQRKMNKTILQHGSILCGDFHLKLVDYLRYKNSEKEIIKTDFLNKTTNLSFILNKEIDYIALIEKIVCGFKQEWNIESIESINF